MNMFRAERISDADHFGIDQTNGGRDEACFPVNSAPSGGTLVIFGGVVGHSLTEVSPRKEVTSVGIGLEDRVADIAAKAVPPSAVLFGRV